jgi:UDP-N-acetylglucosamine--N-acetylmuramyl-(pentapeptide) pyrophosphoryl-undecaprenol N-acetylglucosamine transferase
VASLLIPLVLSTTSHQRDNALYMQHQDAALHLPQTEFTPNALAERLRTLTRPALQAMAERARTLALPDATRRVADELERLGAQRPAQEAAR